MKNKIRKIGWLWQWDFLRPLFWKEYQFWLHNVLPPGWSIIADPEDGADESDYEKLVNVTKRLPTTGVGDLASPPENQGVLDNPPSATNPSPFGGKGEK